MELVIEIDEESYNEIKKIVADGNEMCFMQTLIANGTPLPKGHGDLIDRDDLIDRQAVLDILLWEEKPMEMIRKVKDLSRVTPTEMKSYIDSCGNIFTFPTERIGHWIDHQEDMWIYAKCSECETVHDTQTNYCPNCGARMEESEE